MRNYIFFNVNGKDIQEANIDPEMPLASFLRNRLRLTGTKLSCEEGSCGSCTVVVGKWNHKEKKARYYAVNACLYPLFLVDNCFVLTIEGVGNPKKIHPIQDRLARGHGTQCGFCSPGFVMSTYALLRTNPLPTISEIHQAIKGNLCRCTGYRPILEALYSFTKGKCCRGVNSNCCPCENAKLSDEANKLITFDSFPHYDESQEIIFPPSLITRELISSLHLHGPRVTVFCPTNFEEAQSFLRDTENVKIVSSSMITRLASNQSPSISEKWLSIHFLSSLSDVLSTESSIIIGAALSISELVEAVEKHCDLNVHKPIRRLFNKYSSKQVMNLASWSGALCSASSSSDLCALSLALNWKIIMRREDGTQFTVSTEKLFAVAKTLLESRNIIIGLEIPKTLTGHIFSFKQGHRLGADSTVVNSVCMVEGQGRVTSCRLVVGIEQRPILLKAVAAAIIGHTFVSLTDLLNDLYSALDEDISIFCSTKNFSYKKALARAALFQFTYELLGEQNSYIQISETNNFHSSQIYKATAHNQPAEDACGRPIATQFSDRCTTGEAIFVSDIQIKDVIHVSFVLSTQTHAYIVSVDPSAALALDGVLGYFDKTNIPTGGTNQPGLLDFNAIKDNSTLFADGKVESVGQVIGLIAAQDVTTARRAAKMVRIEYKLLPSILTLEEAIEKESYLVKPQEFGTKEETVEKKLENCEIIIEGETRVGGQEHMYMETQSSVVIPGESDEWIIHSSTQGVSTVQLQVAAVLGISAHKIIVRVKRVGGAFGGKCTQSIFPAACGAVVAHVLGRPVSVVLSRAEDMLITGKRHPALVKYRVGITQQGRMVAAHIRVYLDGGWSIDNSECVTMLSTSVSDAIYHIPVIRAVGYALKTNKNSNTAFRGYGQPQAFYAMECIVHHIAHTVGKSPEQIKVANFNLRGSKNMLGNVLSNDALAECWEECMILSNFEQRLKAIDEFNRKSKIVKRGIAMSTTRFGLTNPGPFEQAAALVQIFLDGTVTVSIGGIEMGQGLNMKCLQIASRALGLSLDKITMIEVGTDKTSNSPDTGGSQGADIHGKAIQACCNKLLDGLRPLMTVEKDWKKVVMRAYHEKVPLQASEHIRIERQKHLIGQNCPTYYTTGAACVEAEIDCLTGEHKLLGVDIVMDVGESINPAIDIGQIEGGFMQGYGYLTCEEVEYDEVGNLLTNSAYKYKIPTAQMVPERFRVKLLRDAPNFAEQVYSSKGIGEPPLLLGVTAFSSIRAAIMAFRSDKDKERFMPMNAPLSAKRILELCSV